GSSAPRPPAMLLERESTDDAVRLSVRARVSRPVEAGHPAPLNRRDSAVTWAAITWGVIVAVVCLRAALVDPPGGVYPIFTGAARSWLAGSDLYLQGMHPFRYSPLAAVLLVPFGLLSDAAGG